MKTILRPPSSLTPYPDNPRSTDEAVEKVADSIQQFGFRQPIVVDKDHVIICGHVRHQAALKLGLKEVPVHVADDLSDDNAKAYRLADNRLAEIAKWDTDKLSQEVQELDLNPNIDLTLLGFSADELAQLVTQELRAPLIVPDMDLDEAPEVPKEPETKPGDLYEIGKHRLLCGDATNLDDYKKLFGKERAHLVFTDPPYNVNYEGGTLDKLTIKNDNMEPDDFRQFLAAFYLATRLHCHPGAAIYVCHADGEGLSFREALIATKWKFAQCLIWVKSKFTIARQDYQYQHEPILYGWNPSGPHRFHGGRNKSTVWNFDKPRANKVHPTMKPIELVQFAIENSSEAGELVFDGFGGSGTTMVAAEATGRKARLLELDPIYCDVIVERMRQLWPNLPILKNGKKIKT